MKAKQPQIECPVNWAEMPAWANFVTIDADGEIDAWEVEPKCLNNWVWLIGQDESKFFVVGSFDVNPEYVYTYIWQREN